MVIIDLGDEIVFRFAQVVVFEIGSDGCDPHLTLAGQLLASGQADL